MEEAGAARRARRHPGPSRSLGRTAAGTCHRAAYSADRSNGLPGGADDAARLRRLAPPGSAGGSSRAPGWTSERRPWRRATTASAPRCSGPITLSAGARSTPHGRTHNVIAILPGRLHPRQNFVYTAHWDHLGRGRPNRGHHLNGALDNAGGVAGLLELARVFAQGPGPTAPSSSSPSRSRKAGCSARILCRPSALPAGDGCRRHQHGRGQPVWPHRHDGGDRARETDLEDYLGRRAARDRPAHAGRSEQRRRLLLPLRSFSVREGGACPSCSRARAGTSPISARRTAEIRRSAPASTSPRTNGRRPRFRGGGPRHRLYHRVGLRLANSRAWPAWRPGTEFAALQGAKRGTAPLN